MNISFLNLKHRAVCISVSDTAVEVVIADKTNVTKFQAVLGPNIVLHGKIQDKKSLTDIVNELISKNKINLGNENVVVFGLPLSQSYIHKFSLLKYKKDADYESLVFNELMRVIPIPENDLIIGYSVPSSDSVKDTVNIIGVGADKLVIKDWQDFFTSIGVKNIQITPEQADLATAVLNKNLHIPFLKSSGALIVKAKNIENDKDEETVSNTDVDDDKKIKKQKIILFSICGVGIIAIGLAFWYQSNQSQQQKARLVANQSNFSVVQTFTFEIPVAVDVKEATVDRITGRLFADNFTMRAGKNEAIAFSKITAGHSLINADKLWGEPLTVNPVSAPASTTPTSEIKYSINWLIYNDKDANTMAQNKVFTTLTQKGIKFAINNIEKNAVKMSDNPNIYLLRVSVSVAL